MKKYNEIDYLYKIAGEFNNVPYFHLNKREKVIFNWLVAAGYLALIDGVVWDKETIEISNIRPLTITGVMVD